MPQAHFAEKRNLERPLHLAQDRQADRVLFGNGTDAGYDRRGFAQTRQRLTLFRFCW